MIWIFFMNMVVEHLTVFQPCESPFMWILSSDLYLFFPLTFSFSWYLLFLETEIFKWVGVLWLEEMIYVVFWRWVSERKGKLQQVIILQSWGWNLGIGFEGIKRAKDLLKAFLVPWLEWSVAFERKSSEVGNWDNGMSWGKGTWKILSVWSIRDDVMGEGRLQYFDF